MSTFRHRYIRFFISSTFADMSRERNLLQQLFSELSATYRVKGWSIEYVDLRWGITEESGSDNRTMRICLDELQRCRQLSPKPNFILLSGQRRGWVPLPESLTEKEARKILWLKGRSYKQLFDRWYKLDCNRMPEPAYVLQPRTDRFTDEEVWTREVYTPLTEGMGDLPSATELEVEQGALKVSDAADHVIAYLRDLEEIPASERPTYVDNNLRKVDRFRRSISDCLAPERIYREQLSFSDYRSDSFARRFKEQMARRITAVVNRVIADYTVGEGETEEHSLLAAEKNRLFVGRKETLALIDRYLYDPEAKRPLWFRAKAGTGKSALMAEVARRYSATHRIVCRFCGETADSTHCYPLVSSIWEELRKYYPYDRQTPRDLPTLWDSREAESPLQNTIVQAYHCRLRAINTGRPLLILIDGLDRLSDEESGTFFSLSWLGGSLGERVKVILTSTDDPRLSPSESVQLCSLEGLSTTEAMQLVEGVLAQEQRTISEAQKAAVRTVLERSECLPIYADLLGHFLCQFASYDALPELPPETDSLLEAVLDYMTDEDKHDEQLVRKSLTLLACDRQGLSQEELLRALSMDEDFREHLQRESHHEIVGEGVPPILWIRLFNDLSFLFDLRYVMGTTLIHIRHASMAAFIRESYLEPADFYRKMGLFPRSDTYRLLAKLYAPLDTPHALMEAAFCLYQAAVGRYNVDGTVLPEAEDFFRLLTNPRYLQRKLQMDRTDLLKDTLLLVQLTPLLNGITAEEALYLRKDLASLTPSDVDAFRMQCCNLHPKSYLRSLLTYDSSLLHDTLAGLLPYDLTTYVSSYRLPMRFVSNDGRRGLFLKNHDKQVVVEQMDRVETQSYAFNSPVRLMDASADLTVHALVVGDWMMVYDVEKGQTLQSSNEISDPCWLSLSEDGKTVAYGNWEHTWITGCEMQNFGSNIGRLSHSGEYLWMMRKQILHRFRLNDGDVLTIDFGKIVQTEDDFVILAADDCDCVLQCAHHSFAIHTYKSSEGKSCFSTKFYQGNSYYKEILAAVSGGRLTVVDEYLGDSYLFEVREDEVKVIRHTTLYGLSALSRNGQYAFSSADGCSYKLSSLMETYSKYATDQFFHQSGINTLACDRSGSVIVVTSGRNELQEVCHEYLLVDHGVMQKKTVEESSTLFFSSCAVSPDGCHLWLSEAYEEGALLCVDRKSGKLLAKVPQAGSKITMRFTPDGKYLVALRGHHIADTLPVFDLIDDARMQLVDRFEPEGLNNLYGAKDSRDMELSSDGRYAILGHPYGEMANLSEWHVVDLRSHLLLNDFEALKILGSHCPTYRFTVAESGEITCESPFGQRRATYLPDLCRWMECDSGLVAVTRRGKVCLFKI